MMFVYGCLKVMIMGQFLCFGVCFIVFISLILFAFIVFLLSYISFSLSATANEKT